MRKILTLLVIAAAFMSFAEIVSVGGYDADAVFYQYTHDEPTNTGDYRDSRRSDQNWLGAQKIQLTIGAECDVWLSNYVQSWYEEILDLDGNVFQMGANQYGAVQLNGDKEWIGNGATTQVMYGDDNSNATNLVTAYFLGHFDGGEIISIWHTELPVDSEEIVDMQQYVHDDMHSTTLASRTDGDHDLAGNVRVNFGITNDNAREFVAFGVADDSSPSGQPLPGMMIAGMLAIGTISAAKRMKRK